MKSSIFTITTKEAGRVFDIKADGSLWWLRHGKLTQAKTDPELNLALAEAIKTIYKIQLSLTKEYEKIKSTTQKAPSNKTTTGAKEKRAPQKNKKGQKHLQK